MTYYVTVNFDPAARALWALRPESCRVYWGSHGCDRWRGHEGPHACLGCWDEQDQDGYVGLPPYYGPDTTFYGEDAVLLGLAS